MSDIVTERFYVDEFIANSYLVYTKESLAENRAAVIDPSLSDELYARLTKLGIKEAFILLTHEHFDHTTGLNRLKDDFNGCVICHSYCRERIALKRNNRPLSIMSKNKDAKNYIGFEPYECHADIWFDNEYDFKLGGKNIRMVFTPGHTAGSCCIEAGNVVFTGDSMLKDTAVITGFPSGSADAYKNVTLPYLSGIDENRYICPGHFEPFYKYETELKDGVFVTKNRDDK